MAPRLTEPREGAAYLLVRSREDDAGKAWGPLPDGSRGIETGGVGLGDRRWRQRGPWLGEGVTLTAFAPRDSFFVVEEGDAVLTHLPIQFPREARPSVGGNGWGLPAWGPRAPGFSTPGKTPGKRGAWGRVAE